MPKRRKLSGIDVMLESERLKIEMDLDLKHKALPVFDLDGKPFGIFESGALLATPRRAEPIEAMQTSGLRFGLFPFLIIKESIDRGDGKRTVTEAEVLGFNLAPLAATTS